MVIGHGGPHRPIVRMIICGSREWQAVAPIRRELLRFNPLSFVISGGAPGADTIAETLARKWGYGQYTMRAHWEHDAGCPKDCKEVTGKPAGIIRNQGMLSLLLATTQMPKAMDKPDLWPDKDGFVVLAFHPFLQASKGTKDMVTRANMAGVATEVYAK